jgi:hypothetical protein
VIALIRPTFSSTQKEHSHSHSHGDDNHSTTAATGFGTGTGGAVSDGPLQTNAKETNKSSADC